MIVFLIGFVVLLLIGVPISISIGASAVLSAVDWPMVVSASALAGLLSLLTSVAGLPEVRP